MPAACFESSAAAAGSGCGMTTVSADSITGCHVLKVEGYSQITGAVGIGKRIDSAAFSVGGHGWSIGCFPDGCDEKSADSVSIFLYLDHPRPNNGDDVRARFRISLVDSVITDPRPPYTKSSKIEPAFSSKTPSWGFDKFVKRTDLESHYLDKADDSFKIRSDVTVVVRDIRAEPSTPSPAPPATPSLQCHLGALLASKVGADVEFEVGGERFTAHGAVLAARSPVFMAELLGPLAGNQATPAHVARIEDMEARVFGALLHFVYTDSLPDGMDADDGNEAAMAQHLLVAADRYNLERLKWISADVLRGRIDTSTVATTLVLAEQHGCLELKEACFGFLKAPGNLTAAMATEGFEHLKSSGCTSLVVQLLRRVAP